MRNTYELPEELIEKVRKLSGAKSKKGAIVVALEEYIRANHVKSLLNRINRKQGFGITHTALQKLRADD